MIELYELAGEDPEHRFSPYCWRIRLALAHKGLEPVTIPWRLHETRLLPGAPGNATVPVLVDDGVVLGGSTAIAFHLEEAYPNGPSLFGGPGGEAHGRFVLAWADLVLIPSLFPILAPAVFAHLHPADRAYFRASREKRLGMTLEEAARRREGLLVGFRAGLAPLRAVLGAQAFLGGEEPSYADYAAFSALQWARCVDRQDVLAPDDSLRRWRGDVTALFDGLAGRAAGAP